MATRKSGNDSAGYELDIDGKQRILHLRVWGFWDVPLAESYRKDMQACFAELGAAAPWFVCADIEKFPPQNDAVARVHGELMFDATSGGMAKACSIVSSALTGMQIKRIAQESRMPELSFFTAKERAVAWLLGKGEPEKRVI